MRLATFGAFVVTDAVLVLASTAYLGVRTTDFAVVLACGIVTAVGLGGYLVRQRGA